MGRRLGLALMLLGLPAVFAARVSGGENILAKPQKRTVGAEADRVTSLPGWGSTEGLYAGYVSVDDKAERSLFYVYVESEGSIDDPVILWLNGGPGCSSLGGGFMSELGPWYPTPGGKVLQANPYRWNRNAHVIFLESPAGVGFSYSKRAADMIVGDARTAQDSREFLLRFYDRYPHLRSNTLYLSGESYAGHYVPNLALEIVKGNEAGRNDPAEQLPLRGFLVGNPWTDTAIDNLGAVDYWWHHAMVSDSAAMGIRANCNFSRIGPLDWHPEHENPTSKDQVCDNLCNQAMNELGAINIYEIYADVCLPQPPSLLGSATTTTTTPGSGGRRRALRFGQAEALARALGGSPAALSSRVAVHGVQEARRKALAQRGGRSLTQQQQQQQVANDEAPGYDPCIDDEVTTYLNLPEVQRALHANVSGDIPGPWADCTNILTYSREDLLSSVLPVYAQLLKRDYLRMLIFSGDIDGIVPVVGTRRWVASLGLKTRKAWRPWYSNSGQVGGHWIEYSNGVSLVTVRGAGHMVPQVQPERAFYMLTKFLKNKAM